MEKNQVEHLKGKQKGLRNKSNKEEVVFNNKNIMYQGNTSVCWTNREGNTQRNNRHQLETQTMPVFLMISTLKPHRDGGLRRKNISKHEVEYKMEILLLWEKKPHPIRSIALQPHTQSKPPRSVRSLHTVS